MTNPLVDAFPGAVQPYSAVKTALAGALALPLKDAAAVAAFNALDLADDATPYPAVIYAGAVYDYDSGDTTTAHDPDAGCITDASGRRYLRVAALKPDWIVLDKDLTAPPGSPAEGDSYYVAAAATGDWAGQDGDYALYSARGWTFRAIEEGHILYVADEERYYRMPASGTLTAGLGDLALGNASVEAKHLAAPFGYVVQAAQTTPPGSPSDRVAYIITATATGAWAGEENKIAEYDSTAAAWTFLTPRAGDTVWDVGAGILKQFTGSAWGSGFPSAGLVLHDYAVQRTTVSSTFSTSWATLMSSDTWAAASTANKICAIGALVLEVLDDTFNTDLTIGIFVDSEVSPRATIAFPTLDKNADYYLTLPLAGMEFNPTDTSAHQIHIKAKVGNASGGRVLARDTGASGCRFQEIGA